MSELAKPTVYVLCGPTAVGKTAVALQLAKALSTEILSADSRQCYIGMDIGTAKPSAEELSAIKHHFISEFPVTTHLSAADFEVAGLKYLDQILYQHGSAVVCGGTGLYLKALCQGLDLMPQVPNAIRLETDAGYAANGLAWLQDAVKREDPLFAETGEMQNPHRLLRALSFVRATNQSILNYRTHKIVERPFRIVKIGLDRDRDDLYLRIDQRVDAMMDSGLLKEVETFFGVRHLKNLQTVGYAELFQYMDDIYTLPEAISKIKQHTRNYAKRQWTWFRKDMAIVWLDAGQPDVVSEIIKL